MTTYIGRAEKPDQHVRIACPIHGTQSTFTLFKEWSLAVGCEKCFVKTPILDEEKQDEVYKKAQSPK